MKQKFTVYDILIYIFFIAYALIVILPLWSVLVISLSTAERFRHDPYHLLLIGVTFKEYARAFSNMGGIVNSFFVSVRVTLYGTVLSLLLTSMGAYALSKRDMPGNKPLFMLVLITMFFNGGLMPFYITVRQLGMMNTIFAMFVPTAISSFYLIVMKSFFQSIPVEMEESAMIEGYNDMQILWKIILPLSVPSIAAIGLFYGVVYWNSYFYPTLFINSNRLFPLPVILRQMVLQNIAIAQVGTRVRDSNFEQFKMACVIIAILPVLVVYPFIQKYFTKGIMIGALKG